MKRSVRQIKIGQHSIKHLVTYLSDPCPQEGPESDFHQHELLGQLFNNPALCSCGPCRYQKLTMTHNGSEWMIEMQATVEGPSGDQNRTA